jgi:hypothetical protein
MLRYKQLWTVERIFRTDNHLLATRPIFHKLDETIRGHVFCSFLALVLKIELEHRIAALGESPCRPPFARSPTERTPQCSNTGGSKYILRAAEAELL